MTKVDYMGDLLMYFINCRMYHIIWNMLIQTETCIPRTGTSYIRESIVIDHTFSVNTSFNPAPSMGVRKPLHSNEKKKLLI